MEKDLILFNDKISKLTKEIVKYEDEKGNLLLIPTGNLMCKVEYLELDEIGMKKALYENIVDKNETYNKIKVNRVIDKSSKTGNKKDAGILIDSEVEVSQVWVVTNGLGLNKSFKDKEKALNLAMTLNNKYLEMAELCK
jgi:hypothetical protein